ncbi:acetolactate synthase large subunit [Myceligenerans indicum]|uniref:Acetolactate synthase n=1 Tax=Myceligenerans indicum TaxID=2593663 RepID=A0ABS1LKZ2_9MICO|nr:acetolactate synthase large subunit [Myceligenerans indicum]MBL0886915.1 acetolactate synthase large subunit [Myceligenerans indicum]
MAFIAAASSTPNPPSSPSPRLVVDGPAPAGEALTGADAVVRSLELLGVTDVFGMPGGAILPVYDALMNSDTLRHILVRHEQGAGHAAEGYAVASGKVGVAIATSGPGATNLVTAIMDARSDSVPLLVITGQVHSALMGTDAFQEADIEGITLPLTKHSYVVTRAADIPGVLAEAYRLAGSGRPGPVLVDITKDAQQAAVPFAWPPAGHDVEGAPRRVSSTQIGRAAEEIARAARPVLYAGGGVVRAGAAAELRELAELTGAPVVTTLMARGVFPDSHPLNLGMPGMHGSVPAVLALQESDLIIAVGARFDERVTGDTALFAPRARVVHIDIDPAEISKIRHAHVPIVADARTALSDLGRALRAVRPASPGDLSSWWSFLDGLRRDYPLGYAPTTDGLIAPQHVIQRISRLSGPDAVYTAGVGQHQMWAAQFLRHERPRHWINSGGAGTMGFAVPAAMGAKIARPDRVVWAIDGDGSFQMTNQELATCALNDIPVKVAIINNSALGMIRQWQTLFYAERYSNSALHTGHETARIPDFVRLADAYGCAALRVEDEKDIDQAIETALGINDRPVVLDFVVSDDSMVWPMVPQGVGNDRIRYARDHELAFGDDS